MAAPYDSVIEVFVRDGAYRIRFGVGPEGAGALSTVGPEGARRGPGAVRDGESLPAGFAADANSEVVRAKVERDNPSARVVLVHPARAERGPMAR